MSFKQSNLYLLLISIHGLIRGDELELGRDADTGGQTKYVVDLARSLAQHEAVGQVDLVTRRIVDSALSEDYVRPVEPLADNARIVRIDAGPEGYIPKEQLWDHLDSFMDNLVQWINTQPRTPDFIHSHYADAGYVGVRLANLAAAPLIHTGHSLGRDKRKRLLANGFSSKVIEQTYNMARRISAEEEVLANADLVITSTHNEIESQYGLYDYYEPDRMEVIPPGTDLELFYPPKEGETFSFLSELEPFLSDPGKPLVLALSRPDERKNISILLKAFGESEALRNAANLLIIAGNRQDIRDLDSGAQSVLTDLLLTIDSMDLYGKVAIPKRHEASDVPDIYRLAAASGGVFINPALTEPFGLTLLEAAACGVPVVATENGGPVDIIGNCRNGILVDPLDSSAITDALLSLLTDREAWSKAVVNGIQGVRRYYTWRAHAETYLERLLELQGRASKKPVEWRNSGFPRYRDRAIFTDLDQSLVGDPAALKEFAEMIKSNRKRVSFGIATGRLFRSALAEIKKHGTPAPDVLISGLGTRIHYGPALSEDRHWLEHIDHQWNRPRVLRVLGDLPGLKLQPADKLWNLKISYYYDPEQAPPPEEIIAMLHKEEVTANVTASFGQFLDITPSRASKGQALRYVALRLDIPLEQILVAGGSGADEDMMRGNTLAVVVGNRHDEELSQLVDTDRIHFSERVHAGGLLDAIEYYDFFASCRAPPD